MAIPGLESATRYQELIYRLLSEDAEFSVPGFIWESDRPEYSFLKRELRWQSPGQVVVAVAAQFGFVQVFNPPGSGRIVTVTSYGVNGIATSSANLALTTTVRGASGAQQPWVTDTRWQPAPIVALAAILARDSLQLTAGNSAAFGTDQQIDQLVIGSTGWHNLPFPIVTLAPGTGLVVADSVVNENFGFKFGGYSRQARPEELSA